MIEMEGVVVIIDGQNYHVEGIVLNIYHWSDDARFIASNSP